LHEKRNPHVFRAKLPTDWSLQGQSLRLSPHPGASTLDRSQSSPLYYAAMPMLIGVDEAGYGPNYGPLVVAATAWRVTEPQERAGLSPANFPDLYKLLRKAVVRSPDKAGKKIAIADSKALYTAGYGVEQLERGVLAALAAIECGDSNGQSPALNHRGCVKHVADLLAATACDPDRRRHELACHHDDDQPLPLETLAEEICRLAALLRKVGDDNGVALLALRARLVYPAEFNALVDHFGSKGAALSHVTLELVRQLIDSLPPTDQPLPTLICLDKHGGRNHYTALLQHHFPESWIEPVSENRNRSRYRWTHCDAPMEAIFRVGCEELLPTALASMTAKYHREVAMRAFNAYWTARLPDLQPTAGYPKDSHRFKAAIAPVQQELAIDDRLLWRSR
jgi:ribonuclease HII